MILVEDAGREPLNPIMPFICYVNLAQLVSFSGPQISSPVK